MGSLLRSDGVSVASVAVYLPESVSSLIIAGRTARAHWMALFVAADLPFREADSLASEGGASDDDLVIVDGRRLAMGPDELRAIACGIPRNDGILVVDQPSRSVAEQLIVRRTVDRLLASGVVIHDPAGVWVEPTVAVAPGATLWRGCFLRGATQIATGAVIHPGVVLDNTIVGERSHVLSHSVCEGAIIGADCKIGPMAHLRPGAALSSDVKVGNFVEIKKSRLHHGVRASHLSYIGDADVGAGANVGAGTITCNYDGFGKHQTRIGPGAFIGSNTALVAPVSVGEGAIVGAGSTVSRDVPDGALMVERADERIFVGKAKTLNERNRRRAERKDG